MLKMNHIRAWRRLSPLRACLGVLATAAILVGCSSPLRSPESPALMTPIEPTATILPTATVAATPDAPPNTPESSPPPATEEHTEEYAVVETSTQYVQAQVDVPVLDAPVEGAVEIGMIADGQTALVTGASTDGAWWRLICADDSIGDCWVSADPTMMLPTAPR